MTNDVVERSLALGFWVKHQDAMEAFEYEDDEVPPDELREIFQEPDSRRILNEVLNAATDEGNELVHALVNAIEQAWGKNPRLSIDRKRKSTTWSEKLHVRRKRARRGRIVELGVSIQAEPENSLHLWCYLWTKGGKNAAISNTRCAEKHYQLATGLPGSNLELPQVPSYWSGGTVLLAKMDLADYLVDGYLESRRLTDTAISIVLRCAPSAVEEMLSGEG